MYRFFPVLIRHLIEEAEASLQEPDEIGRLPIHVAAVSGQPTVLSYLIRVLAKRLSPVSIPPQFLQAVEDAEQEEFTETREGTTVCSPTDSRRLNSIPLANNASVHEDKRLTHRLSVDQRSASTAETTAAANYLDMHHWTPLHHASCEEAINCYQDCLKILLDNGADPMLPTPQGKTALDLAYAAGRSQVLVDVLPKRQLIALLMRIDDIVPVGVRKRAMQKEADKVRSGQDSLIHTEALSAHTPIRKETSPAGPTGGMSERTWKGYSFIRRLADNMENMVDSSRPNTQMTTKRTKVESTNLMTIWRKILLNDNVELLETLRDSMVWRQNRHEQITATDTDFSALSSFACSHLNAPIMTDFETAQNLSIKQLSELFSDCYENGTGVYSHVQASYQSILKSNDFRTVLRGMTGLLTFTTLSTNKVVILRPMYKSLLFLALICGRFRVAEQLLRMRQFDVLPAAVLVTLILRRLRKEPSFPQQVISELERFTERIEAIAVDVLNLVSLKDNTPEKMICRQMLTVPLRTFGDLSLIDLFARAKCNELLSLPCCQRVLDERWLGVLIHLPNWVRWSSRIVPFAGVIYLDYKSRKELASRTSNCTLTNRSVKSYGTGKRTSSLVMEKMGNVSGTGGTPPSSISGPLLAKRMSRFQSTAYTQRPSPWRPSDDQSVQAASTMQTPEPMTTIYDRVVGRDGWHSSPRWYFLTGVYRSPSMKFCLHSLFHLFFLLFFSVVCVYSLHTKFTIPELVALSYVAGYAIEEFRQVILEGLRDGLTEYWKDGWNWIDLLAIGLTSVGFCIRMGANKTYESKYREAHDPLLYSTRNLYMLGLNLFYMRTLYITSISQIIGPRLKMMGDMLRKDLVPLLIVFAIFICSYGVWFQGLIYPNSFYETPVQRNNAKLRGPLKHREDQRLNLLQSFGELFRRAFYSIFEVSIVLEEETCEGNLYCGSETGFHAVIYFVLVLYTGIVNIILINLLIALFSNTVSRIDQKATSLWLAGRYKMVKEYSERTILPPPFNILCVLYEVIHCIIYHCHTWIRQYRHTRKPHKPHAPSHVDDHSDSSDAEPNKMPGAKRNKRTSKAVRVRLRNTRRLQEVLGSGSTTTSDKWELDAVLKFILLQSFALQDRRQVLGHGHNINRPLSMLQVTSVNTETGDQTRYQELPNIVNRVEQRLDQMETMLNRVMDRLEDMVERKTLQTYTSSPMRSPVHLRMPHVKLTRTSSTASEEPIKIPTSKDIFEALERERKMPSKPSLLTVTSPKEQVDRWSSIRRQSKKSRSLSFKE
ncbi:Transient receptor potential cation channel subfamily M member 7 [Fasciola gigantica]|uniref:Transient receptor potential cation channel subfamily M member 7 n=1 Tax=Fasciola gigantica TaxID=46835 RepID=A0A504YJX9_FASGI|nr:Transient receptor potential cation channel subfamily M member 7 [Fasciola gigantica]